MKIVHSRYTNLAEDEKVIEQQKRLEEELGKEIYIKEKLIPADPDDMFVSINNSDYPETITSCVSVIIPVLNGGEGLRRLLNEIRSQKKVDNIEIITVDSGSTDDSVRVANEFNARVISITRSEFNHGGTRNLGASHASGDYLVFTVQDAVPVSDYWLYKMICPFIDNPELDALSAKQFIKADADLYSLWENQRINPHGSDCMWSLPGPVTGDEWKYIDAEIKSKLMHLDDVSSCIRRSSFNDRAYRSLMFGEDMDLAKRIIGSGKAIGYLASTGVYHWHERDAGHLLKRYYIGTKMTSYIQHNNLPYFFRNNIVDFKSLAANIAGTYDLIRMSVYESGSAGPDTIVAVKSFIQSLKKYMSYPPGAIEGAFKEGDIPADNSLDPVLCETIQGNIHEPEKKYNFRQDVIVPNFMDYLSRFSEFICSTFQSLENREQDFISSVFKIFSMAAGVALGVFYLEAESLNNLTPELERIDHLLGEGVCYSEEEINVG
jgi:glycosyltransferase involved in cell wall biosynthesis